MLPEEIERQRQAFLQMNAWLPAESFRNATVVSIVVADVYPLTICRKRSYFVVTFTAVGFDQQVCQFSQVDRALTAEIKDTAIGLLADSCRQHGVYSIVDKAEITQLLAVPDFEWLALHQQTNPNSEESLARVPDAHSWS